MNPPEPFATLLTEPESGLHYRLRQPADGAISKRLLLLHGVGGNETNLAGLASFIDPSVQIILVQGPLLLGPGQHAWFQVSFGGSVPTINEAQAEHSRVLLSTFIDARQRLDRSSAVTVVAGFSQGGILSASVALSQPEQVAAFGILCGRILPELEPKIAGAEHLQSLSAFVAHGRFDNKLPVAWAERSDAWLTELGVPHSLKLYDMGHELREEVVKDFVAWFERV